MSTETHETNPVPWRRPPKDDLRDCTNACLATLVESNVEQVAKELVKLSLPQEHQLQLVPLLFQRACREPKFVGVYASLCKRLKKEMPDSFRAIALECTRMWDAAEGFEATSRLNLLAFLAQLFCRDCLESKMVHGCLRALVPVEPGTPNLEDLEALAKLLAGVGKMLDQGAHAQLVDQYMDAIQSALDVAGTKIPARIRFLLQDLVELRQRGWAPRNPTPAEEPALPQTVSGSPEAERVALQSLIQELSYADSETALAVVANLPSDVLDDLEVVVAVVRSVFMRAHVIAGQNDVVFCQQFSQKWGTVLQTVSRKRKDGRDQAIPQRFRTRLITVAREVWERRGKPDGMFEKLVGVLVGASLVEPTDLELWSTNRD